MADEEEDESADGGGKQTVSVGLASITAAAAGLIAGVGALTATGALGRVQRNHTTMFALAVVVAMVGAFIWLVGSFVDAGARAPTLRRQRVQTGGAFVLLLGVSLGFYEAIKAQSDTEQPAIVAHLDRTTLAVTGEATVGHLASDERMAILVDGLVRRAGSGGWDVNNLSRSFGGPDGDGQATARIDVDVPPGRYDAVGITAFTGTQPQKCGSYSRGGGGEPDGGTACIVIPLSSPEREPQLTASWGRATRGSRAVRIALLSRSSGARDTTQSALVLRVVGLRWHTRLRLYRAVVGAQAHGPIRRTVRLPIPYGVRRVCAQASYVPAEGSLPPLACPIHDTDTATAELRVPS